jgi:dolichol-phosphate mannosyltransferase
MGAKLVELPVRHHARRYGESKYGLNRTFKVVLDLMVVKFFARYLVKPIYLFGGFGFWAILGGFLTLLYALYLRFYDNIHLIKTPLPILAAILFLIGMMSILVGLLAEIIVRTYFESQGRRPYHVRRLINFDQKS